MSLDILAQRFASLGARVEEAPRMVGASGATYRPSLVAETPEETTLIFRMDVEASAAAVIDAHVAALDVGARAAVSAPAYTVEAERSAARFSVALLPPEMEASPDAADAPAPAVAPEVQTALFDFAAPPVEVPAPEPIAPAPAEASPDPTDYEILVAAAVDPAFSVEADPVGPVPEDAGFPDELLVPPEPPAPAPPAPEPPAFTTDHELRALAEAAGHVPEADAGAGTPDPAVMSDDEIDAELKDLLEEAARLPATAPTGLPWPKPERDAVHMPDGPRRRVTDLEVAEQEVSLWNVEGRLSAARQYLEDEVTRETLVLEGGGTAPNPNGSGNPRSSWLKGLVK